MIKRTARMSHSYLLAVLLLQQTISVVYARGQTHSLANMSAAAFTITETDEQSVYTERRQIKVLLNDLKDYPLDPAVRPPVSVTISSKYRNYLQRVRDFQVFEDDVWIVTFPKSGTTWTEEMTWLINHDLDYDTARSIKLNSRSTFLEIGAISELFPIDTIASAERSARPRQIKSHLPLPLLPRQLWTVKPKIVYVARNPKDVAISFYHHYRVFVSYNGTKETFLNELLADQVTYCPMVSHVLDFWALKHEPNVLFLTYETMKRNLRAVLPDVCRHFNKTYSEAQLDELAVHLSFDEMKKNPATNKDDVVRNALAKDNRIGDEQFKFLRKGIVGDYRNELPEEFNVKFDRFIAEQLAGSDFRYEYD